MRKYLLIMALCLLAVACGDHGSMKVYNNQPQGQDNSDWTITNTVQFRLTTNSSITSGKNIHVETNNGVVTLSGKAASEDEKARMMAIAEEVDGVKRVVDDMTVSGS